MSWLDDDYNVDEIFAKNVRIDEESIISSSVQPDTPPAVSNEVKSKQKEIEEKERLAEVEDFMGLSSPENVTNSVSQVSEKSVKNAKAELKSSLAAASTLDDFMRLSQEIADIINIARESEHYVKFLIDINRKCAKDLAPEDIRNISGNINSLNKSQDKKKKSKRPTLNQGLAKKGTNKSELNPYDDYSLADEGQADDYDSAEDEYFRKLK